MTKNAIKLLALVVAVAVIPVLIITYGRKLAEIVIGSSLTASEATIQKLNNWMPFTTRRGTGMYDSEDSEEARFFFVDELPVDEILVWSDLRIQIRLLVKEEQYLGWVQKKDVGLTLEEETVEGLSCLVMVVVLILILIFGYRVSSSREEKRQKQAALELKRKQALANLNRMAD